MMKKTSPVSASPWIPYGNWVFPSPLDHPPHPQVEGATPEILQKSAQC